VTARLEIRELVVRRGGRRIIDGVSLAIAASELGAVVGPNGCGKSTLLRALTGEDTPASGEVFRADGLRIAYFEQNRAALDPRRSLAETVCPDGDHVVFRGSSQHRNGYLERFLFRAEQMVQPVSSLSGGEQSRLLIACLMLQPANLLVLDEPTNDLDLQTLTVLEEALASFEGAVLLVTHDRYFLDQVTSQILAFHTKPGEEGRVTSLVGLAQWEEWHKTQLVPRGKKSAQERAAETPTAGKRKKLSFKEQRDWDTLEARILEAENKLAALDAEAALPEVGADAQRSIALHTAIVAARSEVDALYARWAEIEALLAE